MPFKGALEYRNGCGGGTELALRASLQLSKQETPAATLYEVEDGKHG